MAGDEYEIEIAKMKGYEMVRVKGALNMFNAQIFRTHAEEIIAGDKRFAIDLSYTDYVDSSGMGAMVNLHKRMKTNGSNLILVNPNDRVMGTFQLVKIDRLFKIVRSYDDLP